jgi:hypothetical protein
VRDVLPSFKPNPLFKYIWSFEDNFEFSLKNLALFELNFAVHYWSHWTARGDSRNRIVGLQRGDANHRLKHVATCLPPAGPHTDITCRNRRGHNNCSV